MPGPGVPGRLISLAAAAMTIAVVVLELREASVDHLMDLEIFQDAGRALLSGADLYSEEFPSRSGFRFIYPPFAAILFVPLAPLSAVPMQVGWTAVSIVAVWAVLAMAARRLGTARPGLLAFLLTGIALLFEPLRSHLHFGQVNIFLFLLVTADVLGFTPRRFRGVTLGLAAGVKITPAAFALLFFVRKDWASLARSIATVAGTAVIGHLVRADESIHFWTREFFVTDRAGDTGFVPNQALSGILARAGVPENVAEVAVWAFFVLAAGVATWGAYRLTRQDRDVEALLVVALGVFVASPVAVTHHWSGMIIALPLLLSRGRLPVRIALGVLIVTHLVGTHYAYALPAGGSGERLIQWLLGNAQGMAGMAAFAVLLADAACARTRERGRPTGVARKR